MRRVLVSLAAMVWAGVALFSLAGCGGGSISGGGGGGTQPTTPTVMVSLSSGSITTAQSLTVTVAVSGSSGTPTGSVTLTGGGYTSSATTLSSGSAQIVIPAGKLAAGSDTLSASYTPDSGSSSTYTSASGTVSVMVTAPSLITPTVTVSPGSPSITTAQSLMVTVTVSGGTGNSTPTGSVTLTSGTYSSGAVTLSSGSAQITVPAGALKTGTDTLSASYTPDAGSSSTYASASGTGSVTVTAPTPTAPTVTVSPGSPSITTAQSLTVTVTVSGSSGIPTGGVALSGGGYGPSSMTLSSGSAQFTIPAGSLTTGTDTLSASYTPDSGSSSIYTSASGTATVTVTSGSGANITSFTANPTAIEAGFSSNLTGYFTGGTGVVTAAGGFSQGATSGTSISVSPTTTTTYTLTVTPTGGGTAATKTATVTVSPAPSITSFTAAANPLVAGNSTTLTASFSGGTGSISPGANGTSGSFANVTSGTPVTVNPTATTTYTLTVTPPAGTAITQTLELAVNPSVSVCVSSSCSGPIISNLLLGMDLASWYDVVGNSASITNAFNGAGIKALRWPGGSWSDGYHWDGQDTYPTIGTPSGCDGVNPVADDTYQNFVNKFGSYDLAVTADYGSNPTCNTPGTPSEAAGWAAYAESIGYPIHYMTIGNEEYGSWEYDLHTGTSQNNPTVYACEIIGCGNLSGGLSTSLPSGANTGFYPTIKTAVENAGGSASTTLVGVIVNANNTCCATNADNWDSTVLSGAAKNYDFVEYHYYPLNPGQETDAYVVQQAAQDFTKNINTIQSELSTAGAPNTPIFVGEIGSVSSNPGKQTWSITQGLYAGQILGEAMNDGVARLTWWIGFGNCNGNNGYMGTASNPIYGWQDFGAYNIFSDGTTDYPADECDGNNIPIGTMSPTAEAFNLFQNVIVNGETPQKTTVLGDTTDVRAYAATHGGGYALVLFNLNETTAETVSVVVGSQTTSNAGVTVETYDKEIYDQTDATCASDPGCSYNSLLTYPEWAGPTTTTLPGPVAPPLTLTLAPWSMNVVTVLP